MRIYHVTMPTLNWTSHLRTVKEVKGIDVFPINILVSFYQLRTKKGTGKSLDARYENVITRDELNLFLDSGAFSAASKHVQIDIEKYIAYIKANKYWLTVYANLDDKHSWQRTADNQKRMEDAGLAPLPVFHAGEPDEVMQDLLDQHDYIAIGGVAGELSPKQALTVIRIFVKEADKRGKKVHLFGVTTFDILRSINVYSTDSSSFNLSRWGKFPFFDDAHQRVVYVRYRTAQVRRYEHLIARYGLPTFSFSLKQHRGYVAQLTRALEYLSLYRMSQWVNAMWSAKDGKAIATKQ